MIKDTICAISSAVGDGAISIVRLSGEEAIKIVSSIFTKNLEKVDSHTIHYGYIKDNDVLVDEVLVSIMRAPKSFTTEDIVEINCHGGYAVTNKIFEVVLKNGARMAEPGEFTKRAFLNGRIDLVQAEAVSDIIKAKTDSSLNMAMNSLKKNVSNDISNLRDDVLNIIANIEVNIDYPEYDDVIKLTNEIVKPRILEIQEKITKLIDSSRDGRIIENGLVMSIIGSPNVGKSSLLNCLLEDEKAIVTNVAGTTRDSIEAEIVIGGVLFKLIDTAGIRKTTDIVESIGVKRSLEFLAKSDIVLFVLDSNRNISDQEIELLEYIKTMKHLIVLNKCDLEYNLDYDFSDFRCVDISVALNKNIGKIEEKVMEILNLGNLNYVDQTVITKTRHIAHLNNCLKNIDDILTGIELEVPLDLVSIDINNMYFELGNVLGLEVTDDILDRLFSEFCLGK